MIRTIVILEFVIFTTIFFSSIIIYLSYLIKDSDKLNNLTKRWAQSILIASNIKVTVKGIENIDTSKSYIFMANHSSQLDILVLLGSIPIQFRWLAKAELFKIPLFGGALRHSGQISIDRSNRKSAFKSLKIAADTINNGVSVVIFPEGTRSLDGKIREFKKGGFVLAVEAGVPIIPVIIHGTNKIMPKKGLRIASGNVHLEFKSPIDTSEFTRKTKDLLLQKVRRVMI